MGSLVPELRWRPQESRDESQVFITLVRERHSWALSRCSLELKQQGPGAEGALACAKQHLQAFLSCLPRNAAGKSDGDQEVLGASCHPPSLSLSSRPNQKPRKS